MTGKRLTVLVLPGATGDPEELAAAVASVRAELLDGDDVAVASDVAVAGLEAHREAASAAGVTPITAAALLERAGLIGFVRPGDRWRSGTLAARRRPLDAHPTAMLGVAGHHRRGPGGGAGVTVKAPLPPVAPESLLLRSQVEASAVLVDAAALDVAAVGLLHRPHGDAVVWTRLIHRHGHLPSGEVAVEVRLDPDRHGFTTTARIDAMLSEVTADDGDGEPAGRGTLRRELLRRLFLEAEGHNEIDVADWLAPSAAADARTHAVVDDLQWALRRQREALLAERVRWTAGTTFDDEVRHGTLDLERVLAGTTLAELHGELRVRDSTIQRLRAELEARDSTIERLERERGA